jgi:hypothetical protein
LPQPSVAVHTSVRVHTQPTFEGVPWATVTVGVPQLSVAVASPAEASGTVGLHPRSRSGGHTVNTGFSVSTVQVIVRVQLAVLPQPSVAVYVSTLVHTQPFCEGDP